MMPIAWAAAFIKGCETLCRYLKAVRVVMATQRLEELGTVIKLFPSVEDLEIGDAEDFASFKIS